MTTQTDTDPQPFLRSLMAPVARHVVARRKAEPATLLDNAGHLLRYAVEAGIAVEADTAQRIIQARIEGDTAWNGAEAGLLATAITKLAALVHPVTAETLRACREQACSTIRNYRSMACALAFIILPLSMISFVYNGLSNAVTADLTSANTLAVNLHAQLSTAGTPAASTAALNSLPDLQQYAATIRSIRARTIQLAWFVPAQFDFKDGAEGKGVARLELDPSLSNNVPELVANLNRLTAAYQTVRSDAKAVQDSASLLYGAVGACILPVLYALLGACAYLLRIFSEQVATQTFQPTYATSARFVIAAIGGAIVGLFNNFSIGQGASLSPLAVAFLVGYAADIFFSFLEGSLQNFRKGKAP